MIQKYLDISFFCLFLYYQFKHTKRRSIMRLAIHIVILMILAQTLSYAQSDTLLIKLKSGATEKIPVTEIQSIKFINVTSVEEISSSIVTATNYPNPFMDYTTIEFEMEQYATVDIIIYDAGGNEIRKLECQECRVGTNQVLWDTKCSKGNSMGSGTYFYEIRIGEKVISKKMLLVR
jgi:hypothetical protein